MPHCMLSRSVPLCWLVFLTPLALPTAVQAADLAPAYTPLVQLSDVKIIRCAEEYPATNFVVGHLVDDRPLTEYASNGKGTDTFVEFDFGRPVTISAFRHVDRKDPATVDESELVFSDQSDFSNVIARETIDNVNTPGGTTLAVFATPHTARFVRWQATRLNAQGHSCLGGREISFFTPEAAEAAPGRDQVELLPVQAVQRSDNGLVRPLTVRVKHVYAESVEATLKVGQLDALPLQLAFGSQTTTVLLPAEEQDQEIAVTLAAGPQTIVQQQLQLPPVRHWELCFLPHSHVDIGYTHVQTEVQQKQWDYLRQAMQIAATRPTIRPRHASNGIPKCYGPSIVSCSKLMSKRRPSSCRRCAMDRFTSMDFTATNSRHSAGPKS